MIEITNQDISGLEPAIRGMRNPMNSWDKSDSRLCAGKEKWLDCTVTTSTDCPRSTTDDWEDPVYCVGEKDFDLMKRLSSSGTDHRKFMRMITVYVDIVCNHFWWTEFDTYKVGTVRNSCSKMHKIHVKSFEYVDFSHEGIDEVGGIAKEQFEKNIEVLEWLRNKFNETQEKKYWRAMIELLPMGYNIKATVMMNYEVLANMYHSRKNHKLDEWRTFCKWIETLPYSEIITRGDK